MTKILIVEDEPGLVEILKYNLERQNFDIAVCMDGAKVLSTIDQEQPNLVLMDWMLPNVSGLDLCRQIRQNPTQKTLPIIMLTARSDESNKVQGLTSGADDYMTKPFSMPELFARIEALLRRTNHAVVRILHVGPVSLNFDKKEVLKNHQMMHLGPTEFRLLALLMEHPGHVFSRDELLQSIWGNQVHVEDRTVDVHIRRLRRDLHDDGTLIRTVRSSGYSIVGG